jgi:hypothetical protein
VYPQLLRGWSGLSRPVRMRVLWVVTHYLSLPAALDESWESTFKALADTMSRSVMFFVKESRLVMSVKEHLKMNS